MLSEELWNSWKEKDRNVNLHNLAVDELDKQINQENFAEKVLAKMLFSSMLSAKNAGNRIVRKLKKENPYLELKLTPLINTKTNLPEFRSPYFFDIANYKDYSEAKKGLTGYIEGTKRHTVYI